METRTIPENDWLEFADRFSRDHVGWLATVQVLDGAGVLLLAKDLPLQGISFDTKGSRPCSVAVSAATRRTTTSATWWTCRSTSARRTSPTAASTSRSSRPTGHKR
jgi:hypothetical protein